MSNATHTLAAAATERSDSDPSETQPFVRRPPPRAPSTTRGACDEHVKETMTYTGLQHPVVSDDLGTMWLVGEDGHSALILHLEHRDFHLMPSEARRLAGQLLELAAQAEQ